MNVKIPAGVHEGQGVRVAEEGEPGRDGGPRGDLYCYVRIKPHEFLERDGNDLDRGCADKFHTGVAGGND